MIEYGQHLGKGSYGTVRVKPGNKDIAVKTFTEADFRFFTRELFFLSLFKDFPHICQIVSYDIDKNKIEMVRYQLSLNDLIFGLPYQRRVQLSDEILIQIDKAISYLHSRGIAHNDISAGNIFCNYRCSNLECFLGDFSVTSIKDDYKSHDKEEFLYFDPDPDATNFQSDVWSLGVTVFYFLSKTIRYSDIVITKDYIDYTELYPDYKITNFTYTALCKMLNLKGSNRPSISQSFDIYSKFKRIKNNLSKETVSYKAIKFMKFVTVDRCLVQSPDSSSFVDYFYNLDIIDFITRNFSTDKTQLK